MARPVTFTPDVEGAPAIEVVPDPLRGPRVYVAGERIAAVRDRAQRIYPIPMADGTTRSLRLLGGFVSLRARFEGVDHTIEPRLTIWETFLVVLPLAILSLGIDAPSLAGTAIAAVVTALVALVALTAIRAARPALVRAAVALAASVVGYVVAAAIVSSL